MTYYVIRPDFRTHVFDSNKVVFYSDSSRFLLSNEIFVKITISIIEGSISSQDLIKKLIPKFNENFISQALQMMVNKGFLIIHQDSKFNRASQAFWYENGLDAKLLESSIKNKKISIKAFCEDSETIITKFTHYFENLGFTLSENGDCTIFIVDDYLNPKFNYFVNNNLAIEHAWIPIKYVGSKIWLGPFFDKSDNSCCWDCLKQSLKINQRVEVDLFGNDALKIGYPSNSYLIGNEDLAFRICAVQLAKWIVEPQNSILVKNLLTLDPFNIQLENHPCELVSCKNCHTHRIKQDDGCAYRFKNSPMLFVDENGSRSATLEDTLETLQSIISPITGIVSSYSLYKVNGDYVASSVRNLPLYDDNLSETKKILRIPDVAVGKGKTKLQAKIGCLAESIERYNSTFFNNSYIFSKYQNLPQNGIRPEELLLFSDSQYINRNLINKSFGSFNQVSKRYDDSEIRWTKVYSLTGNDSVFVPSSYCYLNYPYKNEIEMCPGDTNGCASGNTIEEAIVYAILELIERDAVGIWWYNKIRYPGINIKSLKDFNLLNLIEVHLKMNRNFHLIDITSDFNIPTFAAVSADQDGNQIHFGTSSHFNPIVAMTRSIHELNQIMTHTSLGEVLTSENIHPAQKDLANWITKENLVDHPHLNPGTKNDFIYEKYLSINSCDFLSSINELSTILSRKKLKAYWLNQTQININFFTVKVIVPGLRHFWNRLGPGRLYQVPLELGLISELNVEEQMNKIPYFL